MSFCRKNSVARLIFSCFLLAILLAIFVPFFSYADEKVISFCNPNSNTVFFKSYSPSSEMIVYYKPTLSVVWSNLSLSQSFVSLFENRISSIMYYIYNSSSGEILGNSINTVVCANNNSYFHDVFYNVLQNYTTYPTSCQPTKTDSLSRFTCKIETIQTENILAYLNVYKITNNSNYLNISLNLAFANYTSGGSIDSCDHNLNDFLCNSTTEDFGINNFNGTISGSKKQANLIYSLFSLYEVTRNESVLALALNYSSYPAHPDDCNPYFSDFSCANNESDALMSLAYSKAYLNTDDPNYLYFAKQFLGTHLNTKEMFFCKSFYDLYKLTSNESYKSAADSIASYNLFSCDSSSGTHMTTCSMQTRNYLMDCLIDFYSFNGYPDALLEIAKLSYLSHNDTDKSMCNIDAGNYSCVNAYYQAMFLNYYSKSFLSVPKNTGLFYDVYLNSSPTFSDNVTIHFKTTGNISNTKLYFKSEFSPLFSFIDVNISDNYVTIPSENLTTQGIYQYYFDDALDDGLNRYPKFGFFTFSLTRHYELFKLNYESLLSVDPTLTFTYPVCKIYSNSDYACELEYSQGFIASSYSTAFFLNSSNVHFLNNATKLLSTDFDAYQLYSTCNFYKGDYLCEDINQNQLTINESGLYRSSVLALSLFDAYKNTKNTSFLIQGLKYIETNKINNGICDFITDFSCGDQKTQSNLLLSFYRAYLLTSNDYYYYVAINLSKDLQLMQNDTSSLYALSEFATVYNNSQLLSKAYALADYAYSKCSVTDSCTSKEYAYAILGLYSLSLATHNRSILSFALGISSNKRTTSSNCDPITGDYNCENTDELALMRLAFMKAYDSYPLSNNESYGVTLSGQNATSFFKLINLSCKITNSGNFSNSNVDVFLVSPYKIVSYNTTATKKSDFLFNFANINSNETVYINWTLNVTKGGYADVTCSVKENNSRVTVFANGIGHSFNSTGITAFGINFNQSKSFLYTFNNIWDFTLYNVTFILNVSNLEITNFSSDGKSNYSFFFNNVSNYSQATIFYPILVPHESTYFGLEFQSKILTQETFLFINVSALYGAGDVFNATGTLFYDVLNLTVEYTPLDKIYTDYWYSYNFRNAKNYTLYNVSFTPIYDNTITFVSKRNNYAINETYLNATLENVSLFVLENNFSFFDNLSLLENADGLSLNINMTANESRLLINGFFLFDNKSLQNVTFYNDSLVITHSSSKELNLSIYLYNGSFVVFLCNISSSASYKKDSCIMKTTFFSFISGIGMSGKNNISILINKTDNNDNSNLNETYVNIDMVRLGIHYLMSNVSTGTFISNNYFLANMSPNETAHFGYKYYTTDVRIQTLNVSVSSAFGYNSSFSGVISGNESVLACNVNVTSLDYFSNFSLNLSLLTLSDHNLSDIRINFSFFSFNYIVSLSTNISYTPTYSVLYLGLLRTNNSLLVTSLENNSNVVLKFDGFANKTGTLVFSSSISYLGKYTGFCNLTRAVSYTPPPSTPPKQSTTTSTRGAGGAVIIPVVIANETNISETETSSHANNTFKISELSLNNSILNYNVSKKDINMTATLKILDCTRLERIVLNDTATLRIYRDCFIESNMVLIDSLMSSPNQIISPFLYEQKKNQVYINITPYNGSAAIIYYYNSSIDTSMFYEPVFFVYNFPEQKKKPLFLDAFDFLNKSLYERVLAFSLFKEMIYDLFFYLFSRLIFIFGVFLFIFILLGIISHLVWFKNFVKKTNDDAYSLLKSANYHFLHSDMDNAKTELEYAKKKYLLIKLLSFFEGVYISEFLKELYSSTMLTFDFYSQVSSLRQKQISELQSIIDDYTKKKDILNSVKESKEVKLLFAKAYEVYSKLYERTKELHEQKIKDLILSFDKRIKYKENFHYVLEKIK